MVRKRYSDEGALKLLREVDVHLHDGLVSGYPWMGAGGWARALYLEEITDGFHAKRVIANWMAFCNPT